MRIVLAMIVFLLLMQSGTAQGKTPSGNDFRSMCSNLNSGNTESDFSTGYCVGFIKGSSEMLIAWEALGKKAFICFPDNVTVGQLASVFTKYLNNHPEKLHEDGIFLYLEAMQGAFPCTSE